MKPPAGGFYISGGAFSAVFRFTDGKKTRASLALSGALPKAAPGPKIGATRNTGNSWPYEPEYSIGGFRMEP